MYKRPFLVLGHKGMLGQMVMQYFADKAELHTIDYRFAENEKWTFLNTLKKFPNAIIINCIGKIKQKTDNENELLWANALLPLALTEHLLDSQTLIHPSTDCVFDGLQGSAYSLTQTPTARDAYGWSKRLGETALKNRKNTLILRVSIIGPDNSGNNKGLLAWFLSNAAQSRLRGFTNHYWNGITTLEWCKQLEKFLKFNDFEQQNCRIEQMGTKQSYSKYEMLLLFQKIFNTRLIIEPFETPQRIDRRLQPTVVAPPLEQQLSELKQFANM